MPREAYSPRLQSGVGSALNGGSWHSLGKDIYCHVTPPTKYCHKTMRISNYSSRKFVVVVVAFIFSLYVTPSVSVVPQQVTLQRINDSARSTFYVDCDNGNDTNDGTSTKTPFSTPKRAILQASQISTNVHKAVVIMPGTCFLNDTLFIENMTNITLRSYGSNSALSGGRSIGNWTKDPRNISRYIVDVPKDFPVEEIKSMRVGGSTLRRARWPKKRNNPGGDDASNFLFTTAWSSGTADPSGERSPANLGFDASKLPSMAIASFHANATTFTSNAQWFSAYVHVLGCVERDVNSQLTRVMDLGGDLQTNSQSVKILFRNMFQPNQRFYIENVDWGVMEPGEFVHDRVNNKLYAVPETIAQASALLRDGAVVPVLDTLLEIRRSSSADVRDLAFLDTTFYADGYWDGPAQQPSDAAIRINYASNITVDSCSFLESLGGNGVAVGNATVDSRVTRSLFDSLGQGGVVLFGYDISPVPSTGGTTRGNNTQPQRIEIDHNVVSDIGNNLVHVAGVAMRAASYCHVHHNRISHATRYGIQADSFYPHTLQNNASLSSRFNLIEFNLLNDTCRATTDTGAIEMLGSGDPANDGGEGGWYTGSVVRYNNISHTVGSSSSDGVHVCVHGTPAGPWCRGLVWGIYLDGGQSGVTVFGNIIDCTLHGCIFDNAGGNNTMMNNIFIGDNSDARSSVLMDFGAPGASASRPANRSISGSLVRRNIFYSRDASTTMMLAAQVDPFAPELKPNGSDYNLYFSPEANISRESVFPGNVNLSTWQGASKASGVVTCASAHGSGLTIRACPRTNTSTIDSSSFLWAYNETDKKFRLASENTFVMNIDCDGDWTNCALGTTMTQICLDRAHPWSPQPPPAPEVDNQGWNLVKIDDTPLVAVVAVASKKCLEVCREGGDVGGCNGKSGSTLRLAKCDASSVDQTFVFDGKTLRNSDGSLCVGAPPAPPAEFMDKYSIVADPRFVNPESGNFSLLDDSPALRQLVFQAIPPIVAPQSACGIDALDSSAGPKSCLSAFLIAQSESRAFKPLI